MMLALKIKTENWKTACNKFLVPESIMSILTSLLSKKGACQNCKVMWYNLLDAGKIISLDVSSKANKIFVCFY